jgi:drug/metabolite transporter (DMT)-like permease
MAGKVTMINGSELASVIFGLASAATWGVGDFSGGLATRRVPVLTVTLLSQIAGLILLALLALVWRENLPAVVDIGWGGLAGFIGLIGLLALYQAMAIGQMGIAAPVAAVLSASLPVVVGIVTQGLPELPRQLGFGLAVLGIWFISRPQRAQGRPAGLGLAILAGLCFGGFLLCIAQVQTNSVFWPLVAARTVSIIVMLVMAGLGQRLAVPARSILPLIILTGAMDAGGNAFFALAEQAGRLDVAGVLASLYPATTVILALSILKEKLVFWQGIGVLLALIAVPLIAG